jgi:hypothetical protein
LTSRTSSTDPDIDIEDFFDCPDIDIEDFFD